MTTQRIEGGIMFKPLKVIQLFGFIETIPSFLVQRSEIFCHIKHNYAMEYSLMLKTYFFFVKSNYQLSNQHFMCLDDKTQNN